MKYFLPTIIFSIATSFIGLNSYAQKSNNILVPSTPYDSTRNFVKDDYAQYTGQELWLRVLPKNRQELGYANFVNNFKKFDPNGDNKNIYKCCDGYNSKYADLADKRFFVEMVFTNERKDKITKEKVTDTFFKLIDQSSGDGLYYYIEPSLSEYSFPFTVMGYIEKQKSLLKGSQFVFAEEIIINSYDMNTGKAIKATLGSTWSYADVMVDSKSGQLCLIVKDKKGPIPSLEFNRTDAMVAGNAGCNRYFGKYAIDKDNKFVAANIGSTLMACAFENQEGDFLKALSESPVIAFNEAGNLTFTKDNVVLLSFAKGEAPAPIVETPVTQENLVGKWILKSMGSEDLAALFAEKVPTLEIDAEGMAVGNSGCNNYRTKFILEGNVLAFGPLMGTKMACPHLEGEGKYTALLNGALTATIVNDVLTFAKDGQTVLEFTK